MWLMSNIRWVIKEQDRAWWTAWRHQGSDLRVNFEKKPRSCCLISSSRTQGECQCHALDASSSLYHHFTCKNSLVEIMFAIFESYIASKSIFTMSCDVWVEEVTSLGVQCTVHPSQSQTISHAISAHCSGMEGSLPTYGERQALSSRFWHLTQISVSIYGLHISSHPFARHLIKTFSEGWKSGNLTDVMTCSSW